MNPERQKRVLVVDDDKPLLKGLGDFLGHKGFEVMVAESGEEGLGKLESFSPDIILLDISMPGIGGVGFLRRILSSNGLLQYPVLVLTARTTTEDYFKGVPVDGFLAKPCDVNVLESRIQAILEKHRKAASRTLLIGEDDSDVADRLVKVFREAGYEVDEATTGPEVLEKAVVCLPDAILIKQILTGMNGEAVVSVLQAMPRTQAIPTVLYDESCVAGEEGDRLCQVAGVSKYVASENAGQLLEAVEEVLGGSGAGQGP